MHDDIVAAAFDHHVSLKGWRDIWIKEGFASYAEGSWVERMKGRDALNRWATSTYERLNGVHYQPLVGLSNLQPNFPPWIKLPRMTQPFAWPGGARAAVSLSFDDARPSQLDQAVPILDRYALRATFYVSPPAARKRRNDWVAAARRGHELGNHSMTHPCSGNFLWSRGNALENMTLDDMAAQLEGATRFIQDELGAPVSTYAYCCGQKFVGRGRDARSFVPLVAKYFVVGRGFRDEDHNDPHFCDLAQAYGIDADMAPFETLRAQIERAAEHGGWALFAAHDVFNGPRQCMAPHVLEAVCAYCADPANGIWMDTVAAVGAHIVSHRMGARA